MVFPHPVPPRREILNTGQQSHEIAHTAAHHFSERMSSSIVVFAALVLGGMVLGDVGSVSRLGNMLLDLVYLRPGSRKQESEVQWISIHVVLSCS